MLGQGLGVSWAFNGGGYVDFTLALTADTFENYGWAGIGFKQSDDTAGMRKSDIVAFVFSEEVTDRYALGDEEPDFDVDLGGTGRRHLGDLRPVHLYLHLAEAHVLARPLRVL